MASTTKFERKSKPSRKTVRQQSDIRDLSKGVLTLMKRVETKVMSVKHTDGPQPLSSDSPVYDLVHTTDSKLAQQAIVHVLGKGVYRARLATVLNMSSSGGGIVNSTLATSTLGSVTEFASFQAIFNEFFLQHMRVKWQPNSLYNGPMTYLPATTVASLPIGITDLQHSQNAYSSLTNMSDSPGIQFANTGKEFVHIWKNIENHNDVSLPYVPGTSTVQGWAQVSNASLYSGMLQIISQAAPPGLPVSSVLGTFLVEYDVYFRNRY
jgi:hypothetical protein